MNKKSSSRAGNAPTVSDVAQVAGVSAMTVSRVINRTSYVSVTTRAKDMAVATIAAAHRRHIDVQA